MADIPHIVFAARDSVVQSRLTVAQNPYVRRHLRSYWGGVLEKDSRAIIGHYAAKMLSYISS